MKESAFAQKIMRLLKTLPACQFATRVESGPAAPGIPDVFCLFTGAVCLKGTLHTFLDTLPVWLELKTDTGTLRPAQKLWHEKYRKAGGYVGVLRPKMIKGADDLVREIERIISDDA